MHMPEQPHPPHGGIRPNEAQSHYLARGLTQPGGKLPLFDADGQHVHPALVKACIAHGWAEPWFGNPLKPEWLVCRLTEEGRRAVLRQAQDEGLRQAQDEGEGH